MLTCMQPIMSLTDWTNVAPRHPENHGRLARAWAAAEGNGQDVRAACDSSRLATGLTGAHDAASLTNEDNKVEVTDLIRPLSS